MAKIHRQAHPNDFQDNELLNIVLQKLIAPPIVHVQGKMYYDSFKKIPFYSNGVEWIPFFGKPVQYRYTNEVDMLADQPIHNSGYLYYRSDEDIYYEYLGTTTGIFEDDYNPIGGSGVTNNKVKVIYIDPNNLSGTGTIEEQICEYINDNVEINYSKQYSKLNIILGVDPYLVPEPQEILNGILYNNAAITEPRNIAAEGWSVPTRQQFLDLLNYIEPAHVDGLNNNTIGSKLKEVGDTYWYNSNIGSTNEFGFNARGSGYRQPNGSFVSFTDVWTNKVIYGSQTFLFAMSLDTWKLELTAQEQGSDMTSFSNVRNSGVSVRLIKDTTTLSHGQSGIYIGNDGKVYRTICIGTQEWLADNLAETQYRNGELILSIDDNTEWENAVNSGPGATSIPARCFYNNNESNAYPI